eukprot:m.181634 g.181634  ORF g.181634 m.181634 type:complete len:233 (-) comp16631_c1_seq6:343-1041(-)
MWRQLVERLRPLLTPERFTKIEAVARTRLTGIACVVEGLHDTGNVSAIQRSCDAFGVHEFHSIRRFPLDKMKRHRRVSKGSEKWLNVHNWESSTDCLNWLREHGYRVAIAAMHPASIDVADLDMSSPTAFVFGNELAGIAPETVQAADLFVQVPTVGFVSSLNVSVAAGIVLHHATIARRAILANTADYNCDERLSKMTAQLLLRTLDDPHTRHLVKDITAADVQALVAELR